MHKNTISDATRSLWMLWMIYEEILLEERQWLTLLLDKERLQNLASTSRLVSFSPCVWRWERERQKYTPVTSHVTPLNPNDMLTHLRGVQFPSETPQFKPCDCLSPWSRTGCWRPAWACPQGLRCGAGRPSAGWCGSGGRCSSCPETTADTHSDTVSRCNSRWGHCGTCSALNSWMTSETA